VWGFACVLTKKTEYDVEIMEDLLLKLILKIGRGFSVANLSRMIVFMGLSLFLIFSYYFHPYYPNWHEF
jgi:hypothetical protein